MAERIVDGVKSKNISAFVIDYNRNAKGLQEYHERYESFYQIIRNAFPNIPIVLLGAFGTDYYDKEIRSVFEKYKSTTKTYFISLYKLFSTYNFINISPDNIHYTDVGMFIIAEEIEKFIKQSNV